MPNKSEKTLKVTQVKSVIGYRQKAKLTMKALGLRRIGQSVVHDDTPVIRGMIKKVDYLVKVEEAK